MKSMYIIFFGKRSTKSNSLHLVLVQTYSAGQNLPKAVELTSTNTLRVQAYRSYSRSVGISTCMCLANSDLEKIHVDC